MIYRERPDDIRRLFPELPTVTSERLLLRPLTASDAADLRGLTEEEVVYRYEPTFLFEKQYSDPEETIRRMYDEAMKESLILGIFMEERFRGLFEVYSYKAWIHKASIGYRLKQEAWGKGIATEALGCMKEELIGERGIRILTASTMLQNHASAHVLEKNGFKRVKHPVEEDWGFPEPMIADKWIKAGRRTRRI